MTLSALPTPGAHTVSTGQSQVGALATAELDRAYTHAYRYLGNAADAHDAVQEAVLQILRTADRYDPQLPFWPWMARYVHFACLAVLRQRRRRQPITTIPSEPDSTDTSIDLEAVRTAIHELGERDREVIDLHYFADLDHDDAARTIGIAANAFTVRLHRARERLRPLLTKHGVTATAIIALSTLATQSVHAAPTTLYEAVQRFATTASLPKTTLRQSNLVFSILAAMSALIVIGALIAGIPSPRNEALSLHVAQADPPPVQPQVAHAWQGSSRDLLQWMDPQADLQAAGDFVALKRLALTTKPTSLIADPRAAVAMAKFMEHRTQNNKLTDTFPFALGDMALELQAVVASMHNDRATHTVTEARSIFISDWATKSLWLEHMRGRAPSLDTPLGPFMGSIDSKGFFTGMNDHLVAVGETEALRTRATTKTASSAPPAPVWLQWKADSLLRAYAATPDDLNRLHRLFGPQWRGLKPTVEVRIDSVNGLWQADTTITGIPNPTPFMLLGLAELNGNLRDPQQRALSRALSRLPLRIPDPARLAPPTPDSIVHLTSGCDPTAVRFRQMIPNVFTLARWNIDGVDRDRLCDAWSGEFTFDIQDTVPLPRGTMVLGLRSGHADILPILQHILPQDGAIAVTAPPGTHAVWHIMTPIGALQIALAPDRVVVTTCENIEPWLHRVEQRGESALQLDIDLPRIAQRWLPMAYGLMQQHGITAVLPPLPAVVEHLPRYQLAWIPTANGAHCREIGLPMLAGLIGGACIGVVSEANPDPQVLAGQRRAFVNAAQQHILSSLDPPWRAAPSSPPVVQPPASPDPRPSALRRPNPRPPVVQPPVSPDPLRERMGDWGVGNNDPVHDRAIWDALRTGRGEELVRTLNATTDTLWVYAEGPNGCGLSSSDDDQSIWRKIWCVTSDGQEVGFNG